MRLYHRDFSGISWSGKNSGRLSGNWNLMDWERMWAEKVNDDYEFNQEKTDEKDLNLLWDQYIQNPSFKTRLPLVPFLSKYEALYQFIQVDGGEFVYYFLQQLGYNITSDGYVIVNFNRKRRKTCMRLRADDLEEKDLDAILGPILVKYLELWAKGRCRKTCSFWKFLTTTQISLSEWRTGKVLYLYDESFLFQEYRLKQSTYQTTKNKQDLTGIFEKVVQKTQTKCTRLKDLLERVLSSEELLGLSKPAFIRLILTDYCSFPNPPVYLMESLSILYDHHLNEFVEILSDQKSWTPREEEKMGDTFFMRRRFILQILTSHRFQVPEMKEVQGFYSADGVLEPWVSWHGKDPCYCSQCFEQKYDDKTWLKRLRDKEKMNVVEVTKQAKRSFGGNLCRKEVQVATSIQPEKFRVFCQRVIRRTLPKNLPEKDVYFHFKRSSTLKRDGKFGTSKWYFQPTFTPYTLPHSLEKKLTITSTWKTIRKRILHLNSKGIRSCYLNGLPVYWKEGLVGHWHCNHRGPPGKKSQHPSVVKKIYLSIWLQQQVYSGKEEYRILFDEEVNFRYILQRLSPKNLIEEDKIYLEELKRKKREQYEEERKAFLAPRVRKKALESMGEWWTYDVFLNRWINGDGKVYEKFYSEIEQCSYYYNEKANESVWELPPCPEESKKRILMELEPPLWVKMTTKYDKLNAKKLFFEEGEGREKRLRICKERIYQKICLEFNQLKSKAVKHYEIAWKLHQNEWTQQVGKTADMGQFHPDTMLEVEGTLYKMRRVSYMAKHSPFTCWTCTRCKLIFHKSSRTANSNPDNLWLFPVVYLTRDDKIQIQGDLSCLEEIYKERGARNFLQRMVYTPEYLKKRGGPNEKCQSFVDDYIRKMKSGLKSGKSLRYSYQCSQKIQKDFLNLYGTTYQQILPLLLLSSQEL